MLASTMAPTTTRINSTRRLSRSYPFRIGSAGTLRLAGRTPEQVAAFELAGADRSAAHTARLAGPAIDVGAWPAGPVRRQPMVVLRPDHDDLPAPEADLHQLDEIGPH